MKEIYDFVKLENELGEIDFTGSLDKEFGFRSNIVIDEIEDEITVEFLNNTRRINNE
jgi:hypothetical protein|tara:strand:+ start:840 stop:1010 length:171 start_codon:yes stop_codon:yes gene_type:complete